MTRPDAFAVVVAGCLIAGSLLVSQPSLAAFLPSKPVEMVIHSGPGSGADLFVRAMGSILEKEKLLTQRMHIVNKTGGGGARYGLEAWDELGPMQTDAYTYLFGGVSFEEGRKIGARFSLEGFLPRLKCPYLVVHGEKGDTVDRAVAEKAVKEAGGPVKLVVYPDGDHLCINVRHKSWPMMMDWFAEQLAS